MRFIIDVSLISDYAYMPADEVADALLDFLCDGGVGAVEFPMMIESVDGVDPMR